MMPISTNMKLNPMRPKYKVPSQASEAWAWYRRQTRKDHGERHKYADSRTMIPMVFVAARLPQITPSGAERALLIDNQSVRTNWLKKNGLSSVGAVK